MKQVILLYFGYLYFASNVFSQNFELAGIKYLNYPTISTANNNEFSIQEFKGFFNIPTILKNNKTTLVNGLKYGQVRLNNQGNVLNNIEKNIFLHTINYRFIFSHKFNAKYIFFGVIEPTLASDFKSTISKDDFVFQTTAMFIKIINSKLKIGGGLSYTSRFGKPLVIPVVSIMFKSNKHRIKTLLPSKFLYTYEVKSNFDVGIKASINGGYFNITGYFNQIGDINKINYSRTNIGSVIYYNPMKIITLELTGGISTNRKYHLVDVNDNTYENKSSTEAFFNFGIVIKPFKKN